jgi:hypothetical protein
LVRLREEEAVREEAWLRFFDGQPVSAVTTQFLNGWSRLPALVGTSCHVVP